MNYAIELYAPRALALDAAARFGSAVDAMCDEGTTIRYARSLFLRSDEICFLLVEAVSIDTVAEAARRAAITFDRVLEVEIASAQRERGY